MKRLYLILILFLCVIVSLLVGYFIPMYYQDTPTLTTSERVGNNVIVREWEMLEILIDTFDYNGRIIHANYHLLNLIKETEFSIIEYSTKKKLNGGELIIYHCGFDTAYEKSGWTVKNNKIQSTRTDTIIEEQIFMEVK